VTVAFQHRPAHVAHNRQHRGLGDARLGHLSADGVPQVVPSALDARRLADSIPRGL
jgi:hypothetical protein